ncbi:hypothetical protein H634G_01666 [Metarhizium anisopliae BRIP 53293]|uniref:DDE-1 domain-containing protein n=1 Tax=Metarhizium anisopliae BRIP 53293 TaxID=1291518 RepID=A0A0D9PBA3_METAN|nr:hypothetical protein H634G_01666 [Metarhizium anisopliae BRIP 53293]KJK92399.1 hypothetical protein H633G_03756 [Metarhizium anisopliae BRIP 53284]
MSSVEKPPVDRPDEKTLYRLLVVEGFTGHTTLAFAEYCIKFIIIIAILPPHSTHLMQPLDVGMSQPLKAAHQKALRKSLTEGNLTFSRIDFLAELQQVYEAGFMSHNIMPRLNADSKKLKMPRYLKLADYASKPGSDAYNTDDDEPVRAGCNKHEQG